MSNGNTMRRNVLMGTAGLLFACGLAVDRLGIGPTLGQTRDLERQRQAALSRLGSQAEAEAEFEVLASGLGLPDLQGIRNRNGGLDAVVYIGGRVGEAGLRQVELTTDEVEDTGALRQTRFTLRVEGRYADVVDLVRNLEQGPRLLTVDGLQIEVAEGGGPLECRLALSVYDPVRKGAS
jgi:hypothetical protein